MKPKQLLAIILLLHPPTITSFLHPQAVFKHPPAIIEPSEVTVFESPPNIEL